MLSIELLGPPQVRLDGQPVHLGRRKAVALLAYLAAGGAAHPRDALATLLWPETDGEQARANLRRTLSQLTGALGHDYFCIDRETARLEGGEEVRVDLREFYRLATPRRLNGETRDAALREQHLERLTGAAHLARGNFLEGFSLKDSLLFDDWQTLQAESSRQALADVLAQLVEGYTAGGDADAALPLARRWVQLDPLQEQAQAALLTLLAETGQSAVALRGYRAYEQLLADEIGIPPGPAITELFEQIRGGSYTRRVAPPSAATNGRSPLPAGSALPALPHLPHPTTSFVGRSQEIAAIRRLLGREPDCRVVTLTGAGGIGKSRLALAAAEGLGAAFADGIHFIPFVGVTDPALVAATILVGLGLRIAPEASPLSQLRAYLAGKSLLLILDNLEHLLNDDEDSRPNRLGVAELVTELLAVAPGLRFLLTSRVSLNLQSEWLIPVTGLAVPPTDDLPADVPDPLAAFGAMELLYQRMQRVGADFDWRAGWPQMARICRHTDGAPLALELAAPWIQSLTCAEIADRLAEGLDLLATTLRDVEPRHRNLRRVFEETWRMLSRTEQNVLSKLAIFRGGFTGLAAAQVAGASDALLLQLVNKSLIRRDAGGRFNFQELLRQFCTEKLEAFPEGYAALRDRHAAWFLGLLAQRSEDLFWRRQVQTLREFSADIDNLRAAWSWSVHRGRLRALSDAFEAYWQFLDWRGDGEEIIAVFGEAARQIESMRGQDAAEERLRMELLGECLVPYGQRTANNRRRYDEGLALVERGMELIRRAGPTDHRKEVWALIRRGFVCADTRLAEVQKTMDRCISICQERGDQFSQIYANTLWGEVALKLGQREAGAVAFGRAITIGEALGEVRWFLSPLTMLTVVQFERGQYGEAAALVNRRLPLIQTLNNRHATCLVLNDQALLARIVGDFTRALAFYEESMRVGERAGVPNLIPLGLLKLATVRRLLGEWKSAEELLERCAQSAAELHYSMSPVLAERGRIAAARKEYPKAVHLLRQAVAAPGKYFYDHFDTFRVDLGDVLAAAGEAGAMECYLRSLEEEQSQRILPRALQTLLGLARLARQEGRAERALELAALVAEHPATWHEHRLPAQALVEQMKGELPAGTAEEIYRRAGQRDVWAVVDEVLAEAHVSER